MQRRPWRSHARADSRHLKNFLHRTVCELHDAKSGKKRKLQGPEWTPEAIDVVLSLAPTKHKLGDGGLLSLLPAGASVCANLRCRVGGEYAVREEGAASWFCVVAFPFRDQSRGPGE